MQFRYVALQLSLLKVDYTEIMKRVLKNREKSLRSEKMNAKGKASSTVSWVLFGLINLELELLGWRHVMLTYISGEGVTCVESTDFNEIWPENSLNIKQ